MLLLLANECDSLSQPMIVMAKEMIILKTSILKNFYEILFITLEQRLCKIPGTLGETSRPTSESSSKELNLSCNLSQT